MTANSGSIAGTAFGNVDIASETMIFFAQRGQDASQGLKDTIDNARKDARTQKQAEEDAKKIQGQLDALLAGIPDSGKPKQLSQILKTLEDLSNNTAMSSAQRQNARELISTIKATKTGDLLHNNLPAADFQKLQSLVNKYGNAVGPLTENSRPRILAWLSTYTGEKQGLKFIGSPTSNPKATAEDLAFLRDIKHYLNERQTSNADVNWSEVNPQLKVLLSAQFESTKPRADVEDDSVRNVKVQLRLQEFNNAINGSSASSKSIHDAKKSVTDRI